MCVTEKLFIPHLWIWGPYLQLYHSYQTTNVESHVCGRWERGRYINPPPTSSSSFLYHKPMASFSKRLAWSCHGGLVLLPFFFSKNTKSNSTLSCSLQKNHNACCMSVCAFGDSKGFLGDQMCVAVTKSTENTRMDLGSVPLVTSLKQEEQDRMFPLAGWEEYKASSAPAFFFSLYHKP
jgi:hypothetical protein